MTEPPTEPPAEPSAGSAAQLPQQSTTSPSTVSSEDGPKGGRTASAVTVPMVVAGVCLAIPFGAMLWVDSYSRLTPTFIGMPFFYWYQMLWVVLSTALTVVAYVIVRRQERARKGGERR